MRLLLDAVLLLNPWLHLWLFIIKFEIALNYLSSHQVDFLV